MTTPYDTINAIYDRAVAGEVTALGEVVEVLAAKGIWLRQDDGRLWQINQSTPTISPDIFVVGLRYEKRDGTHTEDQFVFDGTRPSEIKKCALHRNL